MNAHKNARTTPFGRAVMIRRVLQEGWSVIAVAASFEVSTRTVRKWLARFRRDGRAGLENRSSAPHRVANKLPALWLASDCTAVARVPHDRRGDRPAAAPAEEHRRQPSPAAGARSLGRARAEQAGAALQPRTRRRARPPRCQEARLLPPHRTQDHRRSPPGLGGCRVGVRPRRGRRRLQARLRRGPAGREAPVGHRLPGPRPALVQAPGHPGRARDDRQRLGLRLAPLPQGVPALAPAPHPHPAIYAQDQRQGRALHPDAPA